MFHVKPDNKMYDIIVVGAGHAGCEAATASAKLGCKTLLISMNLCLVAHMSCNPAIGGVAKGQIVREIDALGGLTGIVTDNTMIQFRMLNKSKGPAMWSPRAQCDKYKFSAYWKYLLETIPNLDLRQDTVTEILTQNGEACGVKTIQGATIKCKKIILTNGTFLNGRIHIGEVNFSGGRIGEAASLNLSDQLKDLGITVKKLKTGTPVRIDARTIDFSKTEEQKGDEEPEKFSFTDTPELTDQMSCRITYTNTTVHDILRTGFEYSPMFQGRIKGVGPRYCPSIEDKIERFPDRERHQLFLEPEGRDTYEYYLNGFSSSLPENVQVEALHHIPGLENASIIRPGYAIEYDYFDPTQLNFSLESKLIPNLYLAGQINGTTGYEEATGQGIVAGINAALSLQEKEPLIMTRNQSYIGVLIDDLVTKGVEDPYRMFTSRAEYRILLRQDNADYRLTPIGYKIGLIDEERMKKMEKKYQTQEKIVEYFRSHNTTPKMMNQYLESVGTTPLTQSTKYETVLLRPQVSMKDIIEISPEIKDFIENSGASKEEIYNSEIYIKYDNYIKKEEQTAEKLLHLENIKIPENIKYDNMPALSLEAREKLNRVKPNNLGQASRISGVSPSDITALMIYLR